MSVYKLLLGGSIQRFSDMVRIPRDPQNRDYAEYLAWVKAGGVPDPEDENVPSTPDPGTVPPKLIASAMNIDVAGGDIAGVQGIFGLAGAIYLDVGNYMLLFIESQPDLEFFAIVSGGAPCMATGEKNSDYLIILATDAPGGAPVDPAQFNVQVFRA